MSYTSGIRTRTVCSYKSAIEEMSWSDCCTLSAGVLDYEEFLKLYKSCLSNAKVRSKYADKMTVKYSRDGKAVLTVMTRSVTAAGALLFNRMRFCCCHGFAVLVEPRLIICHPRNL